MGIERIIGIDFGTSTSVIRVKLYEDGKPVGDTLRTEVFKFQDGATEAPTLIRKQDAYGKPLYIGSEAKKSNKKYPLYENFKVDLENADLSKRMLARRLTEEFFVFMGERYVYQRDSNYFGQASTERTIISYPVKWSEETRQFMTEAARKAGFPNVSGMDEAQAAIHAVTVMQEEDLQKNGLLINGKVSNVLLIDMGAGTTDLVLCRYIPGTRAETEILGTWPKGGKIHFGGNEVDKLLQDFFRRMMDSGTANQVFSRIGVDKFKTWKEETVSPALTRNDRVSDFEALDDYLEGHDIKVGKYCLDRAAFEECMSDYLKQLPELINSCLENVNISGSEIDLVIVTGGHSQWYFVKEMLTGKMPQFGKLELTKVTTEPSRIIDIPRPQETVALGLVYSQLLNIREDPELLCQQAIAIQVNNPQKANDLFLRAAVLGNTEAMNRLGYNYEHGIGTVPSSEKKVEWYRKAADLGHQKAAYNLAICYYKGTGVPISAEKAAAWYKTAADLGFSKAMHSLGLLYLNGDGVAKDLFKAAELFRKAADLGVVPAMNQLAICYKCGWGVEKNLSKALELYRKAADQGDLNAMYNLGIYYESSNIKGKGKYELALKWFQKAADQGHTKARRKTGVYYYLGNGTKINISLAHSYSLEAAEKGDAVAQWNMACILHNTASLEAEEWCRKSAANGHPKAKKTIEKYENTGKWPLVMIVESHDRVD